MTEDNLSKKTERHNSASGSSNRRVSTMSRDIEPDNQSGQTGRVPRTVRTIQISKHAPTNPEIR